MKYNYCLDTNFFITLWYTYYSPKLFIDFWNKLTEIAKEKICYIPEQVYDEIIRSDNDLSKYIKNNKDHFVCNFNEDIEENLINLLEENESLNNLLDNPKSKNGADVFVLAYAKHFDSKIVTLDNGIVKFCKIYKLNYIKPYEFMIENDIRFIVK